MILLHAKIALFFLAFGQSDELNKDWVVVQPPRIGVKVEMPSQPYFNESAIRPVEDQPEIQLRTRSCLMAGGKSSLTFVYHDEHKIPAGRFQINRILDGAVTGALALVNGEMIEENEIFIKNHKGRDFVYRCELDDLKMQTKHQIKIRSRIILVKNRLFSMNYISEESEFDNRIAERFFDSFELVKAADDLPPRPRPGRARELAESMESRSAVDR